MVLGLLTAVAPKLEQAIVGFASASGELEGLKTLTFNVSLFPALEMIFSRERVIG